METAIVFKYAIGSIYTASTKLHARVLLKFSPPLRPPTSYSYLKIEFGLQVHSKGRFAKSKFIYQSRVQMECGGRETASFVHLMTESEPDQLAIIVTLAQVLLLKFVGMEWRRGGKFLLFFCNLLQYHIEYSNW